MTTRNPFAKHVKGMMNKIRPGNRYVPDVCNTCRGSGSIPTIACISYPEVVAVDCEKCNGTGTV